jgi:hypothetical protein
MAASSRATFGVDTEGRRDLYKGSGPASKESHGKSEEEMLLSSLDALRGS